MLEKKAANQQVHSSGRWCFIIR